jgi:hypothetical protein
MSRRILFITMVVLLAASAVALAGESTGRFTSHTGLTTETVLPDGGKAVVIHYYQLYVSDKADDPMNDTAGDCVGKLILSKEGKTISGSGVCFAKDVSGDGTSLWWKVDEAGTARCPDLCGSFGYVDAYGKFKGVTGGGTWVRTHLFGDGTNGTYKSTYTRK